MGMNTILTLIAGIVMSTMVATQVAPSIVEGVKVKPTEIRDFLFGKVSKAAVVAKPTAISYCEANFVKDLNLAYGTRKNYKAISKFISAFVGLSLCKGFTKSIPIKIYFELISSSSIFSF